MAKDNKGVKIAITNLEDEALFLGFGKNITVEYTEEFIVIKMELKKDKKDTVADFTQGPELEDTVCDCSDDARCCECMLLPGDARLSQMGDHTQNHR